ncbi:hypothetical protein [Kitasatospora azatica]|uniref:hypothetical protein n=1 Tax=Kitasatospora azatica TaxID=58347 RepID=UPI000B1460F3|nr:hypothetical protein [Kitasatospora azatica]
MSTRLLTAAAALTLALTLTEANASVAVASAAVASPAVAPPAQPSESAQPAHPAQPTAEIFATSNTAIITDPDDPRLSTHLRAFEREVRGIIRTNGAAPGSSTLLDGVFWSSDLKQATYERSREFDVNRVSADGLHHIADLIRKQYHQESVLTFRFLPTTAPDANAVEIEAPGVTSQRLHDALLADPVARDELGGGSVAQDGRLILIAPVADLPLTQHLLAALGVDWTAATVRYGAEEFVG